MKTALVHDDLMQAGGAERVVAAVHSLYPNSPIYTAMYDRKSTLAYFADTDVRTSYMQKWPVATRGLHKLALAHFPVAFEQFDFSGFDVVLSSSSRFAKGVITPPETCHICYCHTPARFVWRHHEYLSQNKTTRLLAPFLRGMLGNLRTWDVASSQRVDYFVANSENVARRIRKYYQRPAAAVIYPPVQTNKYAPAPAFEVGDHFLVVSRLVGYKRIDLAVDACNKLGAQLRIIGSGPELDALKRRAGPTIQFLGKLSDDQVVHEYARCRAMILAGDEDFGLTPIEAMASGRPVVAYGLGGALETVIEGKTGLFFREQTVDSLAKALQEARSLSVFPEALHAYARTFDVSIFQERMKRFVETAVEDYRRTIESNAVSALKFTDSSVYGLDHARPQGRLMFDLKEAPTGAVDGRD